MTCPEGKCLVSKLSCHTFITHLIVHLEKCFTMILTFLFCYCLLSFGISMFSVYRLFPPSSKIVVLLVIRFVVSYLFQIISFKMKYFSFIFGLSFQNHYQYNMIGGKSTNQMLSLFPSPIFGSSRICQT